MIKGGGSCSQEGYLGFPTGFEREGGIPHFVRMVSFGFPKAFLGNL